MPDETRVAAAECRAKEAEGAEWESFPNTRVRLGALDVARALPVRGRRLVGPWCFLDRFGPLAFTAGKPMDVAPHPHIGLQTVTWLLGGEIVHHDSLGSEAVSRPGGVSVMTAGRGIAHTEETPERNSGLLNGVQLWVALPGAERTIAPAFQHVPETPVIEYPGGVLQVFAGDLAGAASPARHHSPILGAGIRVHPRGCLETPLRPDFEHAALVLEGDCSMDGRPLVPGQLHYLGVSRAGAGFASGAGARVLLIGGAPFGETVLMWWNFVGRTPEEIARARADWEARDRFGEVTAYRGERLRAPELVRFARPEPLS